MIDENRVCPNAKICSNTCDHGIPHEYEPSCDGECRSSSFIDEGCIEINKGLNPSGIISNAFSIEDHL